MDKNLFSGLEEMGFDNFNEMGLYKKAEEKPEETQAAEVKESQEEKQKSFLYDKEVQCPVCNNTYKVRAVKTSSYRVVKKDSDFFIRYDIINPYFYDVWLCNVCGYANMKSDFLKIKEFQKPLITSKLTPKWQGKYYPEVYDINIAIERYKLALYNAAISEAPSSRKAMLCLKLAWMYRILEDENNERMFLKQALEGFNDAYSNEDTPIYGMDFGTLTYLIGELYRRIGDNDNALKWFSKVITAQGIDQKIKELARDQKDLMKSLSENKNKPNIEKEASENNNERKGFFSKFFK